MNQYWFRPKRYGYGATPTNWEGWGVIALDVVVVAISVVHLVHERSFAGAVPWIAAIAIATGALVYVSRRKTAGAWKWRWGRN